MIELRQTYRWLDHTLSYSKYIPTTCLCNNSSLHLLRELIITHLGIIYRYMLFRQELFDKMRVDVRQKSKHQPNYQTKTQTHL